MGVNLDLESTVTPSMDRTQLINEMLAPSEHDVTISLLKGTCPHNAGYIFFGFGDYIDDDTDKSGPRYEYWTCNKCHKGVFIEV